MQENETANSIRPGGKNELSRRIRSHRRGLYSQLVSMRSGLESLGLLFKFDFEVNGVVFRPGTLCYLLVMFTDTVKVVLVQLFQI